MSRSCDTYCTCTATNVIHDTIYDVSKTVHCRFSDCGQDSGILYVFAQPSEVIVRRSFFSVQIYVVHVVIQLSAFMSYGWSSAFLGSSPVATHDRLIGIGVLLLLLANQSQHLQIAMFMWTDSGSKF